MDQYRIRSAIEASQITLSTIARATGRTTAMTNNLKPGDLVIFANEREARRVFNICRDRGFNIRTLVIDPRSPGEVFARTDKERCVFDHSWVEQFYLNEIRNTQKYFKEFTNENEQNTKFINSEQENKMFRP